MAPDDTIFEQFVTAHVDQSMALAVVLSPSVADAEDAVQEAFLRAFRNWEKVATASSPRAYLRRMVVNECRRGPSRPGSVSPRIAQEIHQTSPESAVEHRVVAQQLLGTLPPRMAAALALRFLEDLSYRDVAAALGCREATARSLVRRGIERVQLQEPVVASPVPSVKGAQRHE